jgi:hypothetical protein
MSHDKTASAGDFTRSLSDAIQSNPLPAALIGMGLLWLFTGKSSLKAGVVATGDGLAYLRSQGSETARGLGRSLSANTTSAGESLSDGSAAAARKVSDAAISIGGTAPRIFATARTNIADLMARQPLMLGAIGLGVGAAMAATLRSTAVEAALLGQASADLQARTREIAAAATGHAANLADGVTTAIATEARAQGLTLDSVKQSAREASRKVQSVLGESAERVRSGLN